MPDYVIRPATLAEFEIAVDWAAGEGWNPGLDDAPAFYGADPAGVLMGFLDGRPVASLTVVRYDANYGFLGFYIVRPELRGTGLGLKIWDAGIRHLGGRIIGLDGVIEQQDNYRKSGFVLSERNIRYLGRPRPTADAVAGLTVRPFAPDDWSALAALDRRHVPTPRPAFLEAWIKPEAPKTRRTCLVAEQDGDLTGYGVIRPCNSGYKIGPLFAPNPGIAASMFSQLTDLTPAGSEIALDTPEVNTAAVAMAEAAGMEPAFETARMYKGAMPKLPMGQIFGVTTFELG